MSVSVVKLKLNDNQDWKMCSIIHKRGVLYLYDITPYLKERLPLEIIKKQVDYVKKGKVNEKGIKELSKKLKEGIKEILKDNNLDKKVEELVEIEGDMPSIELIQNFIKKGE